MELKCTSVTKNERDSQIHMDGGSETEPQRMIVIMPRGLNVDFYEPGTTYVVDIKKKPEGANKKA